MKRHMLAILMAVTMVLGMAISLSSCGEGNTLRVGFDPSFEPMSYREEDGTCQGYFLDIMEEAAHRMGMEFEAVPIWWAEMNWNFSQNKLDCFLDCQNNQMLTCEYLWSCPLLQGANRVLVLADAKYKDISDFEKDEYCLLVRSSSEEGDMSRFSELPMQSCLLTYRTLTKAFIQLDNKEGQGVLLNKYVGEYTLNRYPGKYRVLSTELDVSTYAVAFQLGNVELQEKVNTALAGMEADGTLAKISEQWFGRDITKEFT